MNDRASMRALLFGLCVTACAPVHLSSPPAPLPIAPELASTAPVPEGKSRVLIDVVDGPARVSRVVARTDGPLVAFTTVETEKEGELLCVSPCILDLDRGRQSFSFTSPTNPAHTSSVEVDVPESPLAIRHALGTSTPASSAYRNGAVRTVAGGAIFVLGGVTTTLGFINNTTVGSGRPDHLGIAPSVLLATGLTAMVAGLILGGVGISEMSANRPIEQPGSTTTWHLDD